MMRPHEDVPVLVLLEDERDRRFDGSLELVRSGCGSACLECRADSVDGTLQLPPEPLGSRFQSIRLGLRQCAVQTCAECREKRRDERQPQRVQEKMHQRANPRQTEKPVVEAVDAVQQRVLFDGDTMMVVLLLLEDLEGPEPQG